MCLLSTLAFPAASCLRCTACHMREQQLRGSVICCPHQGHYKVLHVHYEMTRAAAVQVHGLADDVRCAALQGVAAIPPEVRQIVLSKLEPHRWSKHQAWCFRLKPQRTEDAPMPRFYGWLDRRAAMMAHLNLLHPGNALMANLQAVVDDINDGDDDEDMWAGLDH